MLGTFVISHTALAAHSEATTSPAAPSTPKTEKAPVKRAGKEILPALTLPRLQLELAQPSATPLTTMGRPRNEVLIFGLRIPTFIAFGLSGLSVGGAVATGFAATHGNDPQTCDHCNDHGVRQRALLITTGVLTGMAAAGVSVGITFMLKAPSNPKRDAIRPRFDLGLSGEKAVAKVGWVFSSF
jgi:hypothetical protein